MQASVRDTAHGVTMKLTNAATLAVLTTITLTACSSSFGSPKLDAARRWLSTGEVAEGCPPVWAAESPMRGDLELEEPEFEVTGEDGLERWTVRATGDGVDTTVVLEPGPTGQECVATTR